MVADAEIIASRACRAEMDHDIKPSDLSAMMGIEGLGVGADYFREQVKAFDFASVTPTFPTRVFDGSLRLEVDGVLAQSESAILLGSLAAAKIGRPGVRPHPALLCVSKYLCRLALERAAVPQPRFVLARAALDVRAAAAPISSYGWCTVESVGSV